MKRAAQTRRVTIMPDLTMPNFTPPAYHNASPLPSFETVRRLFDYDPDTGALTWKVTRGSRAAVGSRVAQNRVPGRHSVGIDGVLYKTHRIIWLWMTGEEPAFQVDHRDLDGSNNRWSNLRVATNSQNMANRPMQSNNTTGLKGAYRNNGRWMARIKKDGVDYYIGTYGTREAAHQAYAAKAKELFGEFARCT